MRSNAWVTSICSLLLLLPTQPAKGACQQSGAGLGCFDAAPMQGPAEPSVFRWFAEGKVVPQSSFALSLHYQYAHKPLELVAPSGDPAGRTIDVVSRAHRLELRAATAIVSGIDVTIAVPLGFGQTGAGSEALSTQTPPTLAHVGLGDMRLALRTRLPKPADILDWTLRLEMGLPTGATEAYLGERSASETLATNVALKLGPVLLATDLGVRVVKPSQFADVRIGSQLLCGLGVAVRIVPKDVLSVALEGLARPILVDSPAMTSTDDPSTTSHATRVIPTEWMASVSSRPMKLPIWFSLGAGTALSLSARETNAERSRIDENFIAPTSPRYKITSSVSVSY